MPRPSKFTAEARSRILKALRVGASLRTAAALAGVSHQTVLRWLEEGRKSTTEGPKARFYAEVEAARAEPKERALGIIWDAMADKPELAWKFVERREDGYAPPMPNSTPAPAGPVIIQLALPNGAPLPLPSSEVQVIDVQDSEPEPTPADTA